jgi:hypothetical protein
MSELFEIPDPKQAFVRGKLGLKAFVGRCDAELDKSMVHLSRLVQSRYALTHIGDHVRVAGFKCPSCGTQTITGESLPPVVVRPGSYPHSPTRLSCTACNKWSVKPSEVAPLLYPTPTARLRFYKDHLPGALAKPSRYFAVRYDDTIEVDRDFAKAVEAAVPSEHELEIDALLVEAFDPAQASEVAASSDALPWLTVPITEEGEPTVLGWHGQRPTVDERASHDRVMMCARDANRKKVAREMRALEQRRSHELGC